MSYQRTGGGFACKSNIRITLAYSSDMSTGIESTYQLGMTQGNTILMPVPIWYETWGNARFIPAIYPGKIRLWTWYQYQTGMLVFKKYPISIPSGYKNPKNLIPGPVCTGEGSIFRPFLDSRHLSLAGRLGLKSRKGQKIDPSPA
jgi:hypothetical protein